NNPYDTDSRVNLTHVTEGDHLDIPSQPQSRSVSPVPGKETHACQDNNAEIGTPSWLGVVQLVLQTLLLALNCVTVGLLVKTLSKYHQTKGIHLSDGEPAWPSGLDTRATNTMLVIGIGGLVATIALLFGGIWQRIKNKALVQNSYPIGLGALLNSPLLDTYDYIIVGGGASGLTVANRLSEDPTVTVLVLEAGPADNGEAVIEVPQFVGQDVGGRYDWNLTTTPQTFLDGAARPMPQGRALGGGTILNAML
ncbi:hypothetical protein B0A49_13652, partial [Cryomyces minteri]